MQQEGCEEKQRWREADDMLKEYCICEVKWPYSRSVQRLDLGRKDAMGIVD